MKKQTQAALAVIGGNAIFGFSFLFSRLALEVTEPAILIAVRFTAAFLLLNLVVLLGRHMKDPQGNPWIRFSLKGKPKKDILLLALFQPVIYFIAENYGIAYTSSAFAGVIIAMIPLTGILLDVFLLHYRPGKVQVLCAFCSVLGVALTAAGSADMHSSMKGLLFLLVAVLSGSLFYVFSSRSGSDYSALERTYVMFGIGSAVFVVFAAVRCLLAGPQILTNAMTAPVFWAAIVYLACVSSVAAFLLLNYGSSYISVSQATLYANITTVISVFAGVLILKEAFSWPQAIGALLIIASVYVAQTAQKTS